MDIGDMIRQTVELDDSTRAALAKACEIKASALMELSDKLQREHGAKSRVTFKDVIVTVDEMTSDYRAAADPDYWIKPTTSAKPMPATRPARPVKDGPQA